MSLSENTLKNYTSAKNRISADVPDWETSPSDVLKYLEERYPNPNSRRAYISACLFWTKDAAYSAALKALHPQANARMLSQELPEKRKENFLTWPELQAARVKATQLHSEGKLGDEDYLLVCLYTLTDPVRADYAQMDIVKSLAKKKAYEGKNLCVLRKKTPHFLFRDYKTSKTYGEVAIPIPAELLAVLHWYVAKTKTSVLYPYTRNALSHRVKTIFKELTGKACSIGLIRHARITELYKMNPSIAQKEALAKNMLHSYIIGEAYRELSVEEEAEGE